MTASLDQQIAEANAQMERLRQAARDGDLVAALALKRMDEAKKMYFAMCADSHLNKAFTGPVDGLKLLTD